MGRVKPSIIRLSALEPDKQGDFFALLAEKKQGSTREGKPFYTCRFRDDRRVVTAMVWSDDPLYNPCALEWQEGQYFKIRGTYQKNEKYGPQLKIAQIRPANDTDRADGFDPGSLIEQSRFHPVDMLRELTRIAQEHILDQPLQRLVVSLLEGHGQALQKLPATTDRYHPFPGGLLEHTLSVTRNCLWLVERYRDYYTELKPALNKDLVLAGAILHEIGRVAELEATDSVSQPTVPGRLFGHLILGRDLVREAAREQGDVNPELLQLLEHLILTHLSLPEWGSPRLPLVPECLILHHADDLDAKMEMYARCLSRDQAPGPFTERDPILGKQLLKGRTV